MKVTDFIDGTVTYEKEGQYFLINGKSGMQMLGEMRGWGHIQQMFNRPMHGSPKMTEAENFQDEVGEWISQAINEKLEREKNK